MDDRFLDGLRESPRPTFARDLRERLRGHEAEGARSSWRPALAAGMAVVLMALAFTLPSVRASAQAFLDLFRVRNFAAVPIDPERLRVLKEQEIDLQKLLADQVETLKEPREPQTYATVREAGDAAGIAALEPAELPKGVTLRGIEVRGDAAARVTINTARLRSLLETLDLTEVQVPAGIDGKVVDVRVPPVVIESFGRGTEGDPRAVLLQARSPEVTLPPGVDLERLAEVGLRIVGLSEDEARRFARTTDWSSTLLVPVPAGAGSFREVEVRGVRGLLVSMEREDRRGQNPGTVTVVLWSEGDRAYGLRGTLSPTDLVKMANSLR